MNAVAEGPKVSLKVKDAAIRSLFLFFLIWSGFELVGALPIVGRPAAGVTDDVRIRVGTFFITDVLRWPPRDGPYSDSLIPPAFALTLAVVSIVLATVWSALRPADGERMRLSSWLYALLRFSLAAQMVAYGLSKILPVQFGESLGAAALAAPIGTVSPRGLLWTMMGYSRGYAIFTGIGELVGGLLLCYRRSALLGALVVVPIMANVLAMNLAFDVPVKFGAGMMLLTALLIVAYDFRALYHVLVLRRATDVASPRALFGSERMDRLAVAAGPLLAMLFCYNSLTREMLPAVREQRQRKLSGPNGAFNVASMNRKGVDIPLIFTDSTVWRRVVFDGALAIVHTTADVPLVFRAAKDSVTGTDVYSGPDDARFSIAKPVEDNGDTMRIVGRLEQDSLWIDLRRVDHTKSRLMSARWRGWGGW